ncbi:metallophosphoesterase [Armatimonas sp.]|uniref:metallophosphoesterase n=1 Tax=Armatimonas sp. TaxID=1872638 RepID=UPI00286AB923|nr:metallophosphoesterase [Armatimonas sp.]
MASVWAIGDIHGMGARLETLLAALPRGPEDVTVFLGDAIDRGPDSRGVVNRLLAEHDAAPDRTVLLWGNHEDMAAAYLTGKHPCRIVYDDFDWFRNGGIETMKSWERDPPECFKRECPDDLARYFSLLQTYWKAPIERFPELAHCVWVHAGTTPGKPVEDTHPDTLLWTRWDFLDNPDLSGRITIHGHTPTAEPEDDYFRIGIDTGACRSGPLTALQIPERHIWQALPGQTVRNFRLCAMAE